MAQDEVSLYNLAVSAAGGRARISAPTETSREAELCRLWFSPTYKQILRAAPWASTRSVGRLALLKERVDGSTWVSGDPMPEYRYAYALPDKCLRPRYLSGFARFSVELLSPMQQAIMTNQEDALLYFTYDQSVVSAWDAQLYMAVAKALAAQIAMSLSGKPRLAQMAAQEANSMIYSARESAANESFEQLSAVALPLQVRGSAYDAPVSPFIYPDGPTFSVSNG